MSYSNQELSTVAAASLLTPCCVVAAAAAVSGRSPGVVTSWNEVVTCTILFYSFLLLAAVCRAPALVR
jgi:hypothetical protein